MSQKNTVYFDKFIVITQENYILKGLAAKSSINSEEKITKQEEKNMYNKKRQRISAIIIAIVIIAMVVTAVVPAIFM